MPESPNHALVLNGVSSGYGATQVLEEISLTLKVGEALSVIGRNGVGKTTLLATIMGHTDQHAGSIWLSGKDLTHEPVYQRARAGIGYVPQEREIFPSLSVRENLQMATRPGRWTKSTVCDLFPNLRQRLNHAGNQLSGGEQQMLAIGRALVANPTLLLLDEPAEGLAPVLVDGLVRVLNDLRQDGNLAIMLVEHNTRVALDFASRTVVMDRGRLVYDGLSHTLQHNPAQLERLIGVTRND